MSKINSDKLIAGVMGEMRKFETKDELEKFFRDMAIVSIYGIRGIQGDEFTQGFLEAAIKDKTVMTIKRMQ